MTKGAKCTIPAFRGTIGGIIRDKNPFWINAVLDDPFIGSEDVIVSIKRKISEIEDRMRIEATATMFPEYFEYFDESNCKWGE